SNPAVLSVAPAAPVITRTPGDLTVPSGDHARFTVEVSGDPAPAVQWQRSTDGGATWQDVPGGTAAELVIPVVPRDADGTLVRVLASNIGATTTSTPAVQVVWPPTHDLVHDTVDALVWPAT